MDGIAIARGACRGRLESQCCAELADEVLPLAHPQVVDELLTTLSAEARGGLRCLRLLEVIPQREQGEDVRGGIDEARVRGIGSDCAVLGPLSRITDRQRSGHDDDVVEATLFFGLHDHPAQSGVNGQPGEAPAHVGHASCQRLRPATRPERSHLLENRDPCGHRSTVRRVEEREVRDLAQAERGHLQEDAGEVGPQDLGIGERRARPQIRLVVQPNADAWTEPPASACTLRRTGLRDRLDGKALHLEARRETRHADLPGVDNRPDARDGEGGLGDVGGEHDPAPDMRREDPVLLLGRQAAIERREFHRIPEAIRQGLAGVTDLALTGEEDEDVAIAICE